MSQNDSENVSEYWDEKMENALLVFVGDGRACIYREGYRNDLGNLCTGKTQGYWNKDRLLEEATKRGVASLDVRKADVTPSDAWDSPLLAQHPDKMDDYEGDPWGDDVGSLTRVSPCDFVAWWLAQGAVETHYDKLPDW